MNSFSLLLLLPSCSLAAPEQKFLREPPDQVLITMTMMLTFMLAMMIVIV